jgi:hypothetical protein
MEKKLTAVEWYMIRVSEIEEANVSNYDKGMAKAQIFIAALAMEKEQHEKTALHFSEKVLDHILDDKGWEGGDFEFKNYYTKTYGK